MNHQQDQWASLLYQAKQLEDQLAARKLECFVEICSRFPNLKYKTFGTLARASREGRLSKEVSIVLNVYEAEFSTLSIEALRYRQESAKLLKETQRTDSKKVLNPIIDSIPPDQYPKLKECKTYPLRHSCNYGENLTSRWNRCEFMKYDNSKSIFDPNRWMCTASK